MEKDESSCGDLWEGEERESVGEDTEEEMGADLNSSVVLRLRERITCMCE
jgi:hypothetical protein